MSAPLTGCGSPANACRTNSDCPENSLCVSSTCTEAATAIGAPCTTDTDCDLAAGLVCSEGACIEGSGETDAFGADCATTAQCPLHQFCDSTFSKCRDLDEGWCRVAAQCPADKPLCSAVTDATHGPCFQCLTSADCDGYSCGLDGNCQFPEDYVPGDDDEVTDADDDDEDTEVECPQNMVPTAGGACTCAPGLVGDGNGNCVDPGLIGTGDDDTSSDDDTTSDDTSTSDDVDTDDDDNPWDDTSSDDDVDNSGDDDVVVAGSCAGRCGDWDASVCACDEICTDLGDCCPDFNDVCGGGDDDPWNPNLAPDSWTCDDADFNNGPCDCGCGAVDADCDAQYAVCFNDNCGPNQEVNPLNSGECIDEVVVPDGWICQDNWYGDNACDCGCGVLDTDCLEPEIDHCQYAPPCDGQVDNVDPDDITQCLEETGDDDTTDDTTDDTSTDDTSSDDTSDDDVVVTPTPEAPDGWMCDPSYYGDDMCDCGCGLIDVDCATSLRAECQFNACHADATIPVFNNAVCNPPDVWEENCHPSWYGNGRCDCGCGAVDWDCQSDVDYCGFDNCPVGSVAVRTSNTECASADLPLHNSCVSGGEYLECGGDAICISTSADGEGNPLRGACKVLCAENSDCVENGQECLLGDGAFLGFCGEPRVRGESCDYMQEGPQTCWDPETSALDGEASFGCWGGACQVVCDVDFEEGFDALSCPAGETCSTEFDIDDPEFFVGLSACE